MDFAGDPFAIFHVKMRRLKKALIDWSKTTYGDIFKKVATLEEKVKVKEIQLEIDLTIANREDLNKCSVELNKVYALEEEFWKKKSGMKWFEEGHRKTKFFHSYVSGRRRKLAITEIQTA